MQKGECDTLEEAELRLRRSMQMESEASQQLKFCQAQYDSAVALLSTLKNQHNQLKKSFLLNKVNHFQTTSARLNMLTTAAEKSKTAPQTTDTKLLPKSSACSQSKHLFQIFSKKEREEDQQQIQQLEQRLATIYAKIGKCVEEEMLSEKAISRIRKESRRAAKLKSIQFLEREIGKYKGWVQESKARVKSDLSDKEVEQKVFHNLQSMKQLMSKKIISNDYIYDQFSEQTEIHKLVDIMDGFQGAMLAKSNAYKKALQECLTHAQLMNKSQITKKISPQQSAPFDSTAVIACFQKGQKLLEEIDQYEISLSLRCQTLQAKVDELSKIT